MRLILFGFTVCIQTLCVKSEAQRIEHNQFRDLVREEIKNFHNQKILELESIIVKMNEQLNRQDEQILSQNERIHEQQRRLNDQDIRIRMHDGQINEFGSHIAKLVGSQKHSVGDSKIKSWIHTESNDFGHNNNQSFINYALRQSIKSMQKEKTGNRNERSTFTKRLGLHDNIVAFYAYMSNGESHPGTHQILVFDVVKTNVGLAFNHHSGMFTVPATGVYVFTWTVISGTHSQIYSQLVVNSDAFGAILTDSDEINDYHTVTGFVVAELNHGDIVYIRTNPDNGVKGVIRSQDDMRTSFSGWKL